MIKFRNLKKRKLVNLNLNYAHYLFQMLLIFCLCLNELNEDDKNINSFLLKSNENLMICKNENRVICFFKIENNFVKPTRVFNL